MGVEVKLFGTFQEIVGEGKIEVSAGSIGDLINDLITEYEELEKMFFEDSGKLAQGLSIMVNGKNIESLDGLDTPIRERDTVIILPLIVGGYTNR